MAGSERKAVLYFFGTMVAFALLKGATGTSMPKTKSRLTTYRQFHANDSYIGRAISCTPEEKICFQYNLVLHKESNTCQPIGGGLASGCDMRVDKKGYQSGFGRMYGTCRQFSDPCPGFRMAHDDRCYTRDVVRNTLCACDAAPARHFLGGVECRCTPPPRKISVVQPKESGRCRIPDIRFPDTQRTKFLKSSLSTAKLQKSNCSSEQKKCFQQGKVWVAAKKGCFTLLQRGSCRNNEVVVLTKSKLIGGSAVCKDRNGGCPSGQIRMGFDGKCHSEREMKLAVPGRLDLNIIGDYDVLGYYNTRKFTPSFHSNACSFDLSGAGGGVPGIAYRPPPCNHKNKSVCPIYQVFNKPPY